MISSLFPVCSYAIQKIPMDGYRITFGLRPNVIQHPSIGIFPYCLNKQGITNNILFWTVFPGNYYWHGLYSQNNLVNWLLYGILVVYVVISCNSHYKHEFSVLSSIWLNWGLSEFWRNALLLFWEYGILWNDNFFLSFICTMFVEFWYNT